VSGLKKYYKDIKKASTFAPVAEPFRRVALRIWASTIESKRA
jgi:hypothetical protein